MKKTFMFLIAVLALLFFVVTTDVWAQFPMPAPEPQPTTQTTTTGEKPADQSKEEEFKGFSGKFSTYKHQDGKYQINIPEEFKLDSEGYTTYWTGPLIYKMACSISVNFVDMPSVSSETLYNINLKSYKEKKGEYTDIQPVKVKWGKKTAFAFRVKEVNHKPGMSSKEKELNDIHRWHLFVFGNGKFYTLGFSANYEAFKKNKVQEMFEKVIKSVELLP